MSGSFEPPFVIVAHADVRALATLRDALRRAGAKVVACASVRVALEAVSFHGPSVIVAELGMEAGNGWEILYAAANATVPTIALDGGGDAAVRRAAYAAGADEVVALPADAEEVATRALALAARARPPTLRAQVFRHRGLVLDIAAHEARLHGRPLALTPQQFAILRALFEANGATLERSRLLARIESLDAEPPSERAVDLHVARLRRRLGDTAAEPRYVASVYGVGYRLAIEAAPAAALDGQAEAVLAALPDPMLVIDEERCVRFANEAAARLLGQARDELIGRTCADVLRCRDERGVPLDGARCLARAATRGGAPLRDVPATVRAREASLDVRYTIAPVPGEQLLTIHLRPRA